MSQDRERLEGKCNKRLCGRMRRLSGAASWTWFGIADHKLMVYGGDGPAGDGQEGWGVSINSQVIVLRVRHQLRLRVLVVAWALTAWFHTSGLCGNHGETITAHC